MGILNHHKKNLQNSAYRKISHALRQIAADKTINNDDFSNEVKRLVDSPMLNPKGDFRL